MLSKGMLTILNEQIKNELYSEYFYLSMSTYCESIDFPGMANFMQVKSQEERSHGMKIYDYIHDRDGRVTLLAIPQPPSIFKSIVDMFTQVLKHEEEITKSIYNIYELATKENDYATQVEMQWFIKEQVEEEKQARDIIQQLKLIGDNESALYMFDKELGMTKFVPEV